MIRNTMVKGFAGCAVVALAATWAGAAQRDDTVIKDVSSEYGPRGARWMVVKHQLGPQSIAPPRRPVTKPVVPGEEPQEAYGAANTAGLYSRALGAGVVSMASLSPEDRVAQSLRGLARDLR